MDTGKIERAAVRAVEDYIDKCPKLEPNINKNDKTPFWDGDLYVYKDEQKGNKKDNFHGRVPVQVKGRSDNSTNFTISRVDAEAYMNDGGCLYFKVLVKDDYSTKILFALLFKNTLKNLLQDYGDCIKIQLEEVPQNPLDFQQKVFDFVSSRNKEPNEKSSPREIADLVKGFENIREYLNEIEIKEARYELESALDQIKNLKADDTIGWRDKFIYYSRKALDLASDNVKGYNFVGLQHDFGLYLYKQKQYNLAKGYYSKVLTECVEQKKLEFAAKVLINLGNLDCTLARYVEAEQEYLMVQKIYHELANNNRAANIANVAQALNNVGNLHKELKRYNEAEKEYLEALKIRRELAKMNPDAYIADVGQTLNNLARLHKDLKRYNEAEQEYQESLKIRRKLAETNRSSFIEFVANTLNNLAALHQVLSRDEEAEQEYQEALEIYRELVETNRKAYIGDVAQTLNNLALLYLSLNQYDVAESDWKEVLEIYRELAESNRDVYIGYVPQTLNNLAILHKNLKRYEEAEQEYLEASNIYRVLSDAYPDVYIGDLARTLENLALLLVNDEQRLDEARDAASEALGIYKELSDKYPQILNSYVEKTQRLLDLIDQHP